MDITKFGRAVEQVQAVRGYSDTELATRAGVSRQNLYRMKRSSRPYMKTVRALARALKVNVSLFLDAKG